MNNMKTVIFVGRVLKSNVDLFIKEGFQVGFFQDIDDPQTGSNYEEQILPNLVFVFPIKFSNLSSIQKSLKFVHVNKAVILICTYDRYFYSLAQIAHTLKLNQSKFMSVEVARNLTNKYFQRSVFLKNYPEITPAFRRIRTFHEAYLFTHKYGFPVIIKPANLSQGKLVNICNNLEELIEKVSYVLDHVEQVYKEQGVNRKPQVVIEEYITGKQYSVDSYVDHEGNITHTPPCHQVISHDLGDDDFETLYSELPSGLPPIEEKKLFSAVTKAIKAMKIVATPTHTEVKINDKGEVKIVEVNVRTGGYRESMLEQSYGFNHIKNATNCYLGLPFEIKKTFLKYSACPQFWAEEEGKFVEVIGLSEAKKLASFVSDSKIKAGCEVGPVKKGYGKVYNAILAHASKEVLDQDLLKIRELISIKVKK
jgi:hypothetical protein